MPNSPQSIAAPDFLTHFEEVEDPRQATKIVHPLDEVLLLVPCAVISGAQGWTSIALYGKRKLPLPRRFLPFEAGTPGHDQSGILFSRLDTEQFQQCFIAWIASLHDMPEGVVGVDGKPLRQSFDTTSNKAAIHMISAWACDRKPVPGQRKVDDRSNEIITIPEFLAFPHCWPF